MCTSTNLQSQQESRIDTQQDNGPQLDKLAQAEKLQLLYNQSFPAILASLLTAVLVCTILWQVQQPAILIGWFLVLLASSFARLILFVRYWKLEPRGKDILSWDKPYFTTLILSSLIWGIGALIIIPKHSVLHQVVVYFFLVGMSGGALAVYSAHRAMTLATIACVLFPITLWFLFRGTLLSTVLVIGAAAFFVTVIRAGKILSATMHQSFRLTHQLRQLNTIAESMARIDELTGLANRRAFYEQGELYAKHCQRNQEILSMMLMDIDFFKQINDTFGHAAGDATLKKLGHLLRKEVRDADICARIGGEEFGILSLMENCDEVFEQAERLRRLIMETEFSFGGKKIAVTASFGVSTSDTSCNLDNLFKNADAALYAAKEAGRNRVVLTQDNTIG